jgi:hypothetical protein
MRIALLFVGRVLSFEHCYERFRTYLLNPLLEAGHTVDAYLSHNAVNTLDDLALFCKLYPVKAYESIEVPDDTGLIPLDPTKDARYTSMKMFYGWHRAWKLMESSGISYDMVLYMRADQYFESPFPVPTEPPEEGILYVPEGYDWSGLNDQMAYGTPAVMRHYTNLYNNLSDIYKKTGVPFHSETYVKLHTFSLALDRFPLQYQLHRQRHP